MGKLIAINISEKRGTEKKEIQEAQLVTDFGIAGDAHAGKWHRQGRLFSFEKMFDETCERHTISVVRQIINRHQPFII